MRLPAALLTVLLLAACSSSSEGAKHSQPTASASTTTRPVALGSAKPAAPTALIDVLPEGFAGGFTSPTGNISCDQSGESVTCSVRDRPWKQMPVEGDCAPGQWETVVAVSEASTASLRGQCGRPDGGSVLTYGRGVQVGKTRCLLRQQGLECLILGTGQGFFVSRSTYRLTTQGSTLAAVRPVAGEAVTRIHPGFRGGFQSPSGNLTCYLTKTDAGCVVEEHSWKVPGKAEECEYEYDGGAKTTEAWISTKGRGQIYLGCGDEGQFGGVELAYGKGLAIGALRCRSLSTGIECTNLSTKHGFVVSKSAYRVF